MGRETLLDEAIAKAKEAEDWQLVEWLRMARGGESAARWYTKKLREASRAERKLLDENESLRELVRDMWRFTGAACKKYPRLFDPACAGGQMVSLNAIDAFEQRMRELGVVE